MKKIKCKCGNTIRLDYSRAERIINPDVYGWACKTCGQYYYRDMKPGIKIKDKDIING